VKKPIVFFATVTALAILSGCRGTELTASKVAEISQTHIEANYSPFVIETITNFDSPIIEAITKIDYPIVGRSDVNGYKNWKPCWKATFTTRLDGWLGPIVLYFDCAGEYLGSDIRM